MAIWDIFKHSWFYHGTVEARTNYVDNAGNKTGEYKIAFYILKERDDGLREIEVMGEPGNSPYARTALAHLRGWVLGGDIPDDYYIDKPETPRTTARAKKLLKHDFKKHKQQVKLLSVNK